MISLFRRKKPLFENIEFSDDFYSKIIKADYLYSFEDKKYQIFLISENVVSFINDHLHYLYAFEKERVKSKTYVKKSCFDAFAITWSIWRKDIKDNDYFKFQNSLLFIISIHLLDCLKAFIKNDERFLKEGGYENVSSAINEKSNFYNALLEKITSTDNKNRYELIEDLYDFLIISPFEKLPANLIGDKFQKVKIIRTLVNPPDMVKKTLHISSYFSSYFSNKIQVFSKFNTSIIKNPPYDNETFDNYSERIMMINTASSEVWK